MRYLLPGPQIDEFDGAGEVSPCGIVGLEGAAHHDCAREVDVFGMGEDGHGEFESGESYLEIRGAVAALEGAVFAPDGCPVMERVLAGLQPAAAGLSAHDLLAGVQVVYPHPPDLTVRPFAACQPYANVDIHRTVGIRPAHGDGEAVIRYPFHGPVAEIDFRFRLRFRFRLVGGIYGLECLDVVFAEAAPAERVGFPDHDGCGVVFRRAFDVGAVALVARRFGRMSESKSMSEGMEKHIHGLFARRKVSAGRIDDDIARFAC